MIVPFVYTLNTVNDGRWLTWVFSKAVSFSKDYGWPVIAQSHYFEHYLDDNSDAAIRNDYDPPQPIYLEKITKIIIPDNITMDYVRKHPSQTDAYMDSIRGNWPEMTDYLVSVIHSLEEQYGERVEAISSLMYHKFLSDACEKCDITPLYFEWGPFRKGIYRDTAYLDFKGLQGMSSIGDNYKIFKKELQQTDVPLLSPKGILSLFLCVDRLEYLWKEETVPKYEIGVIGGYNIPIGVTAFNAVTLDEMLFQSRKLFQPSEIAVRLHPGDPLRTQPNYGCIDNDGNSVDFILKCKRVVCNASNFAYEAALYNRPPYDLGWSQYRFFVNTELNGLPDLVPDKEIINYIAFGALIPFELLKNVEYLRWRLSKPKQTEIYLFHLKYYLEGYGLSIEAVSREGFASYVCEHRKKEENFETGAIKVTDEFKKFYAYAAADVQYLKLRSQYDSYKFAMENELRRSQQQNKKLTEEVSKLESVELELQGEVNAMKMEIKKLIKDKAEADCARKNLQESISWKMTKPGRALVDILRDEKK